MPRPLIHAAVITASLAPHAAEAASIERRVKILENKVAALTEVIGQLKAANKKVNARAAALEKRAASLEKRVAGLDAKTAYTNASTINRSVTLTPSNLYPNDFTATLATPNTTSPFIGHFWLTITVTYTQMSGGFLHFAVEPATDGNTGERCDGFSDNLSGAGVYIFKTYCNLDLDPGAAIKLSAGSFDQGSGTSSAASASVVGTLLEMKRP